MSDLEKLRASGIRSCVPVLVVVAVAIGTGTGPACLNVKTDACIVSGGDFACDTSQICLLPREGTRDFPGDERGCFTFEGPQPRTELTLDDAPEGMVRVPFGMPARFEASSSGDLDSVEGVVAAAAEEQGLDITRCDLENLRPTWATVFGLVRERLEHKGQVNATAIALTASRIEWIEEFNEEVSDWLSGDCVTRQPDTETDSTGTDTGGSESGTEDSTTVGPPQPCAQQDNDCPESMPFCDPVTEQCVRCDDMPDPDVACADANANVPLCVDGTCVACVDGNPAACDAQLLICDPDTMTCIPCSEHAACESGACDLLQQTPTCFDPEHVIDVVPDWNTIVTVLERVPSLGADRTGLENRAVLRLHEAGDGYDFDESVTIDNGAIAFIAADDASPQWSRSGAMSEPMLTVSGIDTRIYIDGVSLNRSLSSVSTGFFCDGGSVDIRRSRIIRSVSGDILATNGCELHIQTSFVGGDVNDVPAIEIENSMLDMLYTTVGAGFADAPALYCTNSTVTVRNSILVNRDGIPVVCFDAIMQHNASNENLGDSNVDVGDWDLNWFVGYASGDFSLFLGNGPNDGQQVFADIATWQSGDPSTDIHGDPRPDTNGATDYPGADVP